MKRLARCLFAVVAVCAAVIATGQPVAAQPRLMTLTYAAEHFPAVAGDTINFIPIVLDIGPSDSIEYEFYRWDPDGWHLVQPYSAMSRYEWHTAARDIGEHVVQVWIRRAGQTVAYEDWATSGRVAVVAPPAPRVVSLQTSTPPRVGIPTTWTANGEGGVAPLQYQFVRLDADGWHVVQDYSASNTYTWTPAPSDIGSHALQVWVRSSQSTAVYEGWLGTGIFTVDPPPPPSVSIVQNHAPPFATGGSVTWTATASGFTGPVEYRFLRLDADGWKVVQDYSGATTYSWTPAVPDAGSHALQVWARLVGSAAAYEAWVGTGVFAVIPPPPPSNVSLTTNASFPLFAGNAVTWTAAASGAGPLEYRFSRLDATWKVVQDYSALNTYSWTPTAGDIGFHAVQVWVRNVGSSASYEAWAGTALFAVQGPVTLTITPPSRAPLQVGWTGRWVASATGLADPEYEFWRVDAGIWQLAQPYGPSDTYVWSPGPNDLGIHGIQARVRSAALGGNPAASITTDLFFVVVVNLSSFTVDTPLPATAGKTISFNATTTGGNQVVEFQYLRWDSGRGWTVAQEYSASSNYSWSTGVRDVGTHVVQVWARTVGSAAPYDLWASTGFFDVQCGPVVTLSEYADLYSQPRQALPGVALSGSPLTFSAAACGTSEPLEYQFVRTRFGGVTEVVQPYGPASEFTWTPGAADLGTYSVDVSARRVGSTTADATASMTFQVKVPGPDLSLTIDTLPFVTAAGETVTVRDTVTNVGPATYPGGCRNDYVFNSSPVASRPIPPLGSGASDTAETTLIVPSLRPGSYWLFVTTVCSDLTDTNNRRWVGTRIVF